MAMIFCYECGKKMSDAAVTCPACGAPNRALSQDDKKWWVAFLLCWFFGVIGAHRYYLRQTGSAIAMTVLTCTIVGIIITGIWSFIDFIVLLVHAGNDAYVNKVAGITSAKPVHKKSGK